MYLREAIDSVYAQTYKDWEIIFWDNASSDNSGEIAKSYDSRLKYFRGNKTNPLYAVRNCALKKASGKYIAFLDCDDIWLPKKLYLQMAAFEKKLSALYIRMPW
jgi:glycosyltransferase involved in cell wall biosynthesis